MEMDFYDHELRGNGYYAFYYACRGGHRPPAGPFATVPQMAAELGLTDYPDNGYVVYVDDRFISSVPSLSTDDLLSEVQ